MKHDCFHPILVLPPAEYRARATLTEELARNSIHGLTVCRITGCMLTQVSEEETGDIVLVELRKEDTQGES